MRLSRQKRRNNYCLEASVGRHRVHSSVWASSCQHRFGDTGSWESLQPLLWTIHLCCRLTWSGSFQKVLDRGSISLANFLRISLLWIEINGRVTPKILRFLMILGWVLENHCLAVQAKMTHFFAWWSIFHSFQRLCGPPIPWHKTLHPGIQGRLPLPWQNVNWWYGQRGVSPLIGWASRVYFPGNVPPGQGPS